MPPRRRWQTCDCHPRDARWSASGTTMMARESDQDEHEAPGVAREAVDPVTAPPNGFAQRITRNDAVIGVYREEVAERHARGASTRSGERIIDRLEVETTLLRAWAERGVRARPPASVQS